MITGTTIWGRFSSIQRADHLAATTIKHCPNNRSTRVGAVRMLFGQKPGCRLRAANPLSAERS